MNYEKLNLVIADYKRLNPSFKEDELYKWRAVKVFQDHWDLTADDFPDMLSKSLSGTLNLLGDGRYFARVMIEHFANFKREDVRQMFTDLFDEEVHLVERVEKFRLLSKRMVKELSEIYKKPLNEFQDMRAVYAYLTLKYPDKYFFYKHEMFLGFANLVDYEIKPIRGRISNLANFQLMAELVREEVKKDKNLIRMHHARLDENCFLDLNCNLLTQDVMWVALSNNFNFDEIAGEDRDQLSFIYGNLNPLPNKIDENFSVHKVDYFKRNQENSILGSLGELLVLKNEKKFLTENGKPKLAAKVDHVSITQGDGLGYDILSFDLKGKPKYIEVKTTKGSEQTKFFVTKREVQRSKVDSDKFHLYRLFNFDKQQNTAKAWIVSGNLNEQLELESEIYSASSEMKMKENE